MSDFRRKSTVLSVCCVLVACTAILLLLHGNISKAGVMLGVEDTQPARNSVAAFAQVRGDEQNTTIFSYDANGRLVQVDYGGGVGIHYTYDAMGNLLQREVYGPPTATPTTTVMLRAYLPMLLK